MFSFLWKKNLGGFGSFSLQTTMQIVSVGTNKGSLLIFHRALIYEESSVAVCSLAIIAVIIGYCNYLIFQTWHIETTTLKKNLNETNRQSCYFRKSNGKKKSQLSFRNKGDSSSCIPCKLAYCFYCLCPQNIVHIIKKMDINHKSKMSVYRHEHKKKNPVWDKLRPPLSSSQWSSDQISNLQVLPVLSCEVCLLLKYSSSICSTWRGPTT